jgi:hypothetical protein
MIRNILFTIAFAAFALGGVRHVQGQAPVAAAANAQNEEPLQMVIDYGQGNQKRRQTHHGVMEPVGLAIGQPVTITLEFSPHRAGESVLVSALDGGQVDPSGSVVIPANGKVGFNFQPGRTPGLYRLLVQGAEQYELHLYAFDPNRPVKNPHGN